MKQYICICNNFPFINGQKYYFQLRFDIMGKLTYQCPKLFDGLKYSYDIDYFTKLFKQTFKYGK